MNKYAAWATTSRTIEGCWSVGDAKISLRTGRAYPSFYNASSSPSLSSSRRTLACRVKVPTDAPEQRPQLRLLVPLISLIGLAEY
jgi:hypothetical protein